MFNNKKNCLTCGKSIIRKRKSSWIMIKYCSTKCRLIDYKKNKNTNMNRKCKTFHERMVKKINKKIKGKIISIQTIPNHENPDIITKDAHIEVERVVSYPKFKKKYAKNRDNTKKHILYVVVDERIREFFDEIVFFE